MQVRDFTTFEKIWSLKTLESADILPIRTIKHLPADYNKLYLAGACGIVQIFDLKTGLSVDSSESELKIAFFSLQTRVRNINL